MLLMVANVLDQHQHLSISISIAKTLSICGRSWNLVESPVGWNLSIAPRCLISQLDAYDAFDYYNDAYDHYDDAYKHECLR